MGDITININRNLILSKDGEIRYSLKEEDDLSDIIWINCDINNIKSVQEQFKLHPITVEDILSDDIREKIELFDNYMFIICKTKSFNNVNLLLFDNLLISFSNPDFVDQIVDKLNRRDKPHIRSDSVLHLMLDTIIDNYSPVVYKLVEDIDTLDELINKSDVSKQSYYIKTSQINSLRKDTSRLYRSIISKKEVIGQLTNKNIDKYISKEIKIYFQDVLDNIIQMHEWLLICKENIAQSQSTYTSFLTLEATLSSDETNEIMRRLTSAAIILMLVTIITGLFGMNVTVPGQNTDSLYWFFGIIGGSCLGITILWKVFKRWDLL